MRRRADTRAGAYRRAGRQSGAALLELALAALLSVLGAAWLAQSYVAQLEEARVQSSAEWMRAARGAVAAYLQGHGKAMAAAPSEASPAVDGYARWARPTMAELRGQGLLPDTVPAAPELLGGVQVVVRRSGQCPGPACRLDALLYSQRPWQRSRPEGEVDEARVARWLLATQGLGAAVWPWRAAWVQGASLRWPNPPAADLAPLPAGTVAMAVGHDVGHDQWQQTDYLRVGDERDPDFQGDASIRGHASLGGNLAVSGHLRLQGAVSTSEFCAVQGAVAMSTSQMLVVCQQSRWRGLQSGGGFSVNERFGCQTALGVDTSNPLTRACSCPEGYAQVLISDSGIQQAEIGRTEGYLCVG